MAEEEVVAVEHTITTPEANSSAASAQVSSPAAHNLKSYMFSIDHGQGHGGATGTQKAKEPGGYKAYGGFEEKPRKMEVFSWCSYELCSYFVLHVLIPIVFPLIISQIVKFPKDEPVHGFVQNTRGLNCSAKEMKIYHGLTSPYINVNHAKYSALEWTSISWAIGILIAAPILGFLSTHLDRGHQPIIAIGATAIGAIFCLPSGFFKTVWIFPPYIAFIIAAITVASASHTRHLGFMVRGFTGPTIQKSQFQIRRAVSGWLSLYAAAAGSLGCAVIASFTYHMLKEKEEFISLWVVSIYSGLIWLLGIFHFLTSNRPTNRTSISRAHALSIFKYPHALGSLAGVFLSSLTTMCIFTGTLLYLVGQLCFSPASLLYFWLIYFIFPLVLLPLMHPLQHVLKSDSVKMQILGFALSAITAGMGFYYKGKIWRRKHVLALALFQSTSTGILHAFGRVLLVDCSPYGKEGAFSTWFVLVKVLGTGLGFTIASVAPGNIGVSFGVAFFTSVVAMAVLIFGNVSDLDGAVAAGNVEEDHVVNYGEGGVSSSPLVHGVDVAGSSTEIKECLEKNETP
ncbi:hypothetical protein FEM48_Zijuj11G0130600 [Ziziphus jujuba var. spinosa]|uniref:Major facilitator superfamily domain-containing protein n=1 Tax=Ziziphus jujuba var. spinosa TaxID=714518 RepID=A0A978UJ34_ZIZJJ|nr:hypothetical protein FEM48_Zijuj11G0130600 [Ziziphus jujuba var. spinosa]